GGVGRGGACQQRGGGDQQCAADGSGAAPQVDTGAAGPEAVVLELPPVSYGSAQGQDAPGAAGGAAARQRLVAVAQDDTGPTEPTSVRTSTCAVRKSLKPVKTGQNGASVRAGL